MENTFETEEQQIFAASTPDRDLGNDQDTTPENEESFEDDDELTDEDELDEDSTDEPEEL